MNAIIYTGWFLHLLLFFALLYISGKLLINLDFYKLKKNKIFPTRITFPYMNYYYKFTLLFIQTNMSFSSLGAFPTIFPNKFRAQVMRISKGWCMYLYYAWFNTFLFAYLNKVFRWDAFAYHDNKGSIIFKKVAKKSSLSGKKAQPVRN